MLNFRIFLQTMYKYVKNLLVKISIIFAQYFDYYAIIRRGPFFRGHGVDIEEYTPCAEKRCHFFDSVFYRFLQFLYGNSNEYSSKEI